VDLDLVFLGTSGSMPTAQRARTAMLLGAGERCSSTAPRTQRQLLRSNVGLIELREIFLTHYTRITISACRGC
jgi:ribonuclease BN (tRNA processing enzyme)